MALPSRLTGVERSGIRHIMERARLRPGTLRLEVGEPDFPTPAHIVEAGVRAARNGFTHYTPGSGIPELRQAAATKLEAVNQIVADPDSVVVTAGAVNGIVAALMALTSPGDSVAVPDPSWPNYISIARSLGLRVIRYPLDPSSGFTLDPAALEEVTRADTRVIIVNSPSNPTGTMHDISTITQLLEHCGSLGAVVLSDECYDQIVFDGHHVSPASLDSGTPVVSVFSLSKTYAMTGWRVGYVTGPTPLIQDIARVQETWNSCCNSISQKAAVAALTNDQSCVAEMVSTYRVRRDLALTTARNNGLHAWSPTGAFYAMIQVGTDDSLTFAEELVDHYGVSVAPGSTFGNVSTGMVRISLAAPETTIRQGIERIATAINDRQSNG